MSVIGRIGKILRARIPAFKQREFKRPDPVYKESEKNSYSEPDMPATDQDGTIAGYYANLELPYGAGFEDVESAWKRMLKKYHPDLHSNDPRKQETAHHLVQGLNKAHDELEKYLNKQG